MTDMEKKVMIRLCAKIVAETDLYETDKEVQNLIDWVCLSEQIKENNNTIRNLTGEYKKIEPDCREGVRAQLERMKELCKLFHEGFQTTSFIMNLLSVGSESGHPCRLHSFFFFSVVHI